jgi:cellulose biosynthesis protein BcsQ
LKAVKGLSDWRDYLSSVDDLLIVKPMQPVESLECLESAPVSVKLLKESGAGHILRSLRNHEKIDKQILERIITLVQRWKKYHKQWEIECKNKSQDDVMSSTIVNEIAMERCSSWMHLYKFNEEQTNLKFDMYKSLSK